MNQNCYKKLYEMPAFFHSGDELYLNHRAKISYINITNEMK